MFCCDLSYCTLPPGRNHIHNYKRVCITANSLQKIPPEFNEKYDVVILDEAEWVAWHMISSTMVKDVYPVMARLKTLLRNTKTVILSQAKLSEVGVKFYTDLKNIFLYDPQIHSLEIRRKKPSPQRMHWFRET